MTTEDDPYLWLEEVAGDDQLAWVRTQNERTEQEFPRSEFANVQDRIKAALDDDRRVPHLVQRGEWLYEFRTDAHHPRGVWRRTRPEPFRQGSPEWETVLDIDALGESEGVSWVWHGSQWPRQDAARCLVALSRGGADADDIREFDVESRTFVAGGFHLPESKGNASWLDDDTLIVSRDFGPGTMNSSGYPDEVRLLKRGQELADAVLLLRNTLGGPFVGAWLQRTGGREHLMAVAAYDFFDSQTFLQVGEVLHPVPVPRDAEVGVFHDCFVVRLRSSFAGVRPGSLIAAPIETVLAADADAPWTVIFEPGPRRALDSWFTTAHHLVLNVVDNVRSALTVVSRDGTDWTSRDVALPISGTATTHGLAPETSDVIHLRLTEYVTPPTLYEIDLAGDRHPAVLTSQPAGFVAEGTRITRHDAISADGTAIPYTVIAPNGAALDGSQPTVLYGYGGFEISLLPDYRVTVGIGWLERGGTYVVANLRGGGEFGPEWHASARKENRQRCYDDFIAVAEDLIARGYTSPSRLGISGGSNGGLLVGAAMTQRPDLFAAVCCEVPLLDMRRFHLLLAGASWIGEYGDPDDPDEWAFIGRYSPYQNVHADRTYPPVLFTTSTRDDRVHPGHARKMAARMQDQGHTAYLFENIEGGHGGAADNGQLAYRTALAWEFFARHLIAAPAPT